jgi:hypothetical protein
MRRAAFVLSAVVFVSCGKAGGGSTPEERDVSGNYTLTYDNKLKIRLDVAGAVREVNQDGYGGIVNFGMVNGSPTTLDLTAFCAKPEVQCPSEAFWSKVAITQPDLLTNRFDLQKLVVVNDTEHILDAGVRAASLSGLVDHSQQDQFLLGLGASGGATANCVALSVSLAGGRFSRVGEHEVTTMELRTMAGRACSLDAGVLDAGSGDAGADAGPDPRFLPDGGLDCTLVPITRLVIPPGAIVNGIKEGKVFLGWAGGCAFGPVLAGATLTFETGYTGRWSGIYDPPPFTEAPVVLPDGGSDAGADAGP